MTDYVQARRKKQSRLQQLTEREVVTETTQGLSGVQYEHSNDINCDEGPSLEVRPSEQELKETLLSREDLRETNAVLEKVKENLHHAEKRKRK